MLPFFRGGQRAVSSQIDQNHSSSIICPVLATYPPPVRRGQITGKWQHPPREFNDLQIELTSRSAPKSFLFHFNRELFVGLSYAQFSSGFGKLEEEKAISGLSILPGERSEKEKR